MSIDIRPDKRQSTQNQNIGRREAFKSRSEKRIPHKHMFQRLISLIRKLEQQDIIF